MKQTIIRVIEAILETSSHFEDTDPLNNLIPIPVDTTEEKS